MRSLISADPKTCRNGSLVLQLKPNALVNTVEYCEDRYGKMEADIPRPEKLVDLETCLEFGCSH